MQRKLRVFHCSSYQRVTDATHLRAAQKGSEFLLVHKNAGAEIVTITDADADYLAACVPGATLIFRRSNGYCAAEGAARFEHSLHAITPEALAYYAAAQEEVRRVEVLRTIHCAMGGLSLAQAEQLAAALMAIEQGAAEVGVDG